MKAREHLFLTGYKTDLLIFINTDMSGLLLDFSRQDDVGMTCEFISSVIR